MSNEVNHTCDEELPSFFSDSKDALMTSRDEFRLWVQIATCFLALIALSPLTIDVAVGQSAINVSIELASEDAIGQPIGEVDTDSTSDAEITGQVETNNKPEQTIDEESSGVNEPQTDEPSQVKAEVESDDAAALAETIDLPDTAQSDPAAKKDPVEVHPLSVEPTRPLLPRDRPEWISAQPDYQSDVHQFVVASIPTSVQSEVEANLDAALAENVRAYLNEMFSQLAGAGVELDRLPTNFVRTNLIDESKSYLAQLDTASGPLYQKWVMVQVTPEQRAFLRGWYGQQIQRKRLLPLGVGLVVILSAIGLSSLLLKRNSPQTNDTSPTPKTQHGMRRRLFHGKFAVLAAVVITIFVAGRLTSIVRRQPSPNRSSQTSFLNEGTVQQVQQRIEHQSDRLSRKQKMAVERVKHQVERSVQRVKQRLDQVNSCCPD